MNTLERLKELSKQATPGPWHLWGEKDWWESQIDDLTVVVSDLDSGDEENSAFICNLGAPVGEVFTDIEKNPNMANANLIVTAINALPDLIAVVEAAKRVNEWDLVSIIKNYFNEYDEDAQEVLAEAKTLNAALAELTEAPHD